MSNLATRLLEAMWTRDTAQTILAALGPNYTVMGSVAKRGQSDHDLDLRRAGVHPSLGAEPEPTMRATLERLGYEYVGQQLFSPADKTHSRKTFGPGWDEIHSFRHPTTGHRIEVWTQLLPI
jgi:hypothetical protein